MKRLGEFFTDGNFYSMTRLMLFLWGGGVLVNWSFVCFKTKVLAPIPESIVTIIAIFISGKVVQSFSENGQKP